MVKIEWIHKICKNDDDTLNRIAFDAFNCKIVNTSFFECNLHKHDVATLCCKNKFWEDVLSIWCKYNFEKVDEKDSQQISNQILWYNSHIKIGGQVCFSQELYDKGIIQVKDLSINGRILGHKDLCLFYEIEYPVLKYNQLVDAIPIAWRKTLNNNSSETGEWVSNLCEISEKPKWSKIIYNKLIQSDEGINRVCDVWKKRNLYSEVEETQNAFCRINKLTSVTKYRDFQYRLLHNAIFLNN